MKSPIETVYTAIIESEVFRLDGPAVDLPEALIALAHSVRDNETDESTWSIGEHTEAPLGDLIVGAYWSLTEWHAGQSSPEYAALCALGEIFSPGMTGPPDPEDTENAGSELTAFELCNQWFQERADRRANP
jgi:hypothetical protein